MYEIFDVRHGRALASFDDLMSLRIYMSLLSDKSFLDWNKKGEGYV